MLFFPVYYFSLIPPNFGFVVSSATVVAVVGTSMDQPLRHEWGKEVGGGQFFEASYFGSPTNGDEQL